MNVYSVFKDQFCFAASAAVRVFTDFPFTYQRSIFSQNPNLL